MKIEREKEGTREKKKHRAGAQVREVGGGGIEIHWGRNRAFIMRSEEGGFPFAKKTTKFCSSKQRGFFFVFEILKRRRRIGL